MDIKSIAMAVVLGAFGGFSGSYYMVKEQTASIHERLNQSAPVVVIDFAKIASAYPDRASQEEIEKRMVKTKNAILTLKDAGYLVLNASAVVDAPSDLYLPEDVLK